MFYNVISTINSQTGATSESVSLVLSRTRAAPILLGLRQKKTTVSHILYMA